MKEGLDRSHQIVKTAEAEATKLANEAVDQSEGAITPELYNEKRDQALDILYRAAEQLQAKITQTKAEEKFLEPHEKLSLAQAEQRLTEIKREVEQDFMKLTVLHSSVDSQSPESPESPESFGDQVTKYFEDLHADLGAKIDTLATLGLAEYKKQYGESPYDLWRSIQVFSSLGLNEAQNHLLTGEQKFMMYEEDSGSEEKHQKIRDEFNKSIPMIAALKEKLFTPELHERITEEVGNEIIASIKLEFARKTNLLKERNYQKLQEEFGVPTYIVIKEFKNFINSTQDKFASKLSKNEDLRWLDEGIKKRLGDEYFATKSIDLKIYGQNLLGQVLKENPQFDYDNQESLTNPKTGQQFLDGLRLRLSKGKEIHDESLSYEVRKIGLKLPIDEAVKAISICHNSNCPKTAKTLLTEQLVWKSNYSLLEALSVVGIPDLYIEFYDEGRTFNENKIHIVGSNQELNVAPQRIADFFAKADPELYKWLVVFDDRFEGVSLSQELVKLKNKVVEVKKDIDKIYQADKYSQLGKFCGDVLKGHHDDILQADPVSFIKVVTSIKGSGINLNYRFVESIINTFFRFSDDMKHDLLEIMPSDPKNFRNFISFVENVSPDIAKKGELKKAFELYSRLIDSPSAELSKVAIGILGAVNNFEELELRIEEVEGVFLKNSIPIMAKKALIFKILYRDKESGYRTGAISPMIKESGESPKVVEYLTYVDLLRSSIESGSDDIIEYAEILEDGSEIIELKRNNAVLNADQQVKYDSMFIKLQRLSGLLGDQNPQTPEEVASTLRIREGQTVVDRVTELFLAPLGIKSVEELRRYSKQTIENASTRNLEAIATSQEVAQSGDLVKSFRPDNLEQIFSEGFVSKEFLGAEAGSDLTPLDIDLLRIGEGSSLVAAMEKTRGYGNISAIVKPGQRFIETDGNTKVSFDRSKPELFTTGIIDSQNHVGIRSAMAITNVDAFVMQERSDDAERRVMTECVKKGLYVPIYDKDQNLLFSPEQFDQMRVEFAGTKWSQEPQAVTEELLELEGLTPEQKDGLERVKTLRDEVVNTLRSFFESAGIQFSHSFNARDLTVAEIDDTGSTGRGTSLPNDFDFDISLRLGHEDYKKVGEFIDEITAATNGEDNNGGYRGDSYQFRKSGVTDLLGQTFDEPFDLDINFKRKEAIPLYESHDAVADRLQSIEGQFEDKEKGREVRQKVVGQILEAKKVLKGAEVYKKGDFGEGQGGLGGIGVENWILTKGQGSLRKAAESFIETAVVEGAEIGFAEFKSKYMVIDAGANILARSGSSPHDNFISKNMTEAGYKKMVAVLQQYLRQLK